MTITQEQAQAFFESDVAIYENRVSAFASRNGIVFSQQQFDALVSLDYNTTSNPLGNSSYRIVKAINKYKTGSGTVEIPAQYVWECFATWHHINTNIDNRGLFYRRMNEARIFAYGDYTRSLDWAIPSWLVSGQTGPDVPEGWVPEEYSSGSIIPTPTPSQDGHSPNGVVDEICVKDGNSIYIRGWAFDPDDQNYSVLMEAYIDTTRENATAGSGYQFWCSTDRPDVKNAYGLTGSGSYGFENTHATSLVGDHTVYVYATNQVGGGDHSLLGTYTLNFRDIHAPYGSIDLIEGGSGTLRVAGWAKDDDDPDGAVTVHVYIGGPAGSGANAYGIKAEGYRSDVGNHAFDKVINIKDSSEVGTKDIYVYWLNLGAGNGNPHIVKQATIKAPNHPYGSFDTCEGGDGTIYVTGWAKDDDDPNAEVIVHIYVGGRASDAGSVGYVRSANVERSDVGRHGFDSTIYVDKTGTVDVYAYAINVGAGWSNTLLGKKTVTVNPGETDPPTISNVTVETDKDGYTVSCDVADAGSGIDRVVFPTWTLENGQDDIAGNWATTDAVKGTIVDGRASFRVKRSDHNNEYGTYRTHIYVYDKCGNEVKYEVPDISNSHTVSFDANGGEGVPESVTKYLGVELTLPSGRPSRNGFVFAGYATAQNGSASDAVYQPGGIFDIDADTTLYAVWISEVPDAVLPADLQEIGEQAFSGCDFKYVVIPEGTTAIKSRAFSDCANLRIISIPESVTSIASDAFSGVPDGLMIEGTEGSYAEYYAERNGFTFSEK